MSINSPTMPGMPGWVAPTATPSDAYAIAQEASRGPGRKPTWETTEELARDWQAYLDFNRANPVEVGRKGRRVLPPLTIAGFCAHCGIDRATYYATKKRSGDVPDMLNRINEAIHHGLVSGAITRAYDSNIVARVTGLADKTEATVTNVETSQEDGFFLAKAYVDVMPDEHQAAIFEAVTYMEGIVEGGEPTEEHARQLKAQGIYCLQEHIKQLKESKAL